MRSTPLVSVLLPVFNRERLVLEAVRSIQAQTMQDWELLILDDASTDGSFQSCQTLAAQDPRIRVFSNSQNLGVAATRNRLVSLASGEFIAHQDSDDISMPDRLALQVRKLESFPEAAMVSGICEWIDLSGKILRYSPYLLLRGEQYPDDKAAMFRLLYLGCVVENATCMVRSSMLSQIPGPFDPALRMCCDWRFAMDVAHRFPIVGLAQVLVRLRRGPGHDHLWSHRQLGFLYARLCLRGAYREYRNYVSGVNYFRYRQAVALHLLWSYGWSTPRYLRLLKAIAYDPTNKTAWKQFVRAMHASGKEMFCRLQQCY